MSPSKDNTWIETASGRKFSLSDPSPGSVNLHDIAVSLSNQCRFGGAILEFYSVAQHCVHVSNLLPVKGGLALRGLLHDAAEAYTVDVPTPLKRMLKEYGEIEERVLRAIAMSFHMPTHWLTSLPDSVHVADKVALATERRDLRRPTTNDWGPSPAPDKGKLRPVAPAEARGMFLRRLDFLMMVR